MRGVTGGSLPAQIWKRFVTAATPLLRTHQEQQQSAAPVTAEMAPSVQTPGAQCDLQACAARYSSFRSNDCSYQPFGGRGRKICDLQPRNAAGTMPTRSRSPEAAGAVDAEAEQASGARETDRRARRQVPSQPTMALGESEADPSRELPRRRYEGARQPFGPDFFRLLDGNSDF
jgi:membrane peptidoglycan carboxypeptidase